MNAPLPTTRVRVTTPGKIIAKSCCIRGLSQPPQIQTARSNSFVISGRAMVAAKTQVLTSWAAVLSCICPSKMRRTSQLVGNTNRT